MEPISLTIGVVALLGLPIALVATVEKIQKTVKAIKRAQPELLDLVNETKLFAGIYDAFIDVFDEESSNTEQTLKIKRDLIAWTKKAVEGLENLLSKVQAVGRNPEYFYSFLEVMTAYVIWLKSKDTLKYLRASLSVARQSMVAFTNIRIIEKLNEELAHLKSALSPTERQRLESKYKRTVEDRIGMMRNKVHYRREQLHKIKKELKEAIEEVKLYQKNVTDQDYIQQTQPLLQFKRSVNQYVERAVVQERADRRDRRRYRRNSVLMSESSATIPTQSTQRSDYHMPVPGSPPTSPEPSIAKPAIKIQPEEEEASPPVSASPIIEHANNISEERTASRLPITPLRLTQISPLRLTPNRTKPIPPSSPPPNTSPPRISEPSIKPAEEARGTPRIIPSTQRDGEGFLDKFFEDQTSTDEQARDAGSSIWKATGAFGGHVPKSRRHRQRRRSRSPQGH